MENREEQILSEIRTMMSAIRLQIDSLDAKIAQLQELFGHDEVYEGPIDLDIEDDLPADNADIPAETSPAEAFQQVLPEGLSWSEEPSREEHSLPVQDCLTDEPSECCIPEVAVSDETVEFADVSDDEEDDDDDYGYDDEEKMSKIPLIILGIAIVIVAALIIFVLLK